MARIETDPNYSSPTFSRATAATDLFKKEDVQQVAAALSTHDHTPGKGKQIAVSSIPVGSITSSHIADGAIQGIDIAASTLSSTHIADGSILGTDIAGLTIQGANMQNGSIGAQQLADGGVTGIKLAADIISQSFVASGAASNPTTTSAAMADCPEMAISITARGGDVLVWFSITLQHSSAGGYGAIQIALDGVDSSVVMAGAAGAANGLFMLTNMLRIPSLTGAHVIKGRWANLIGTGTLTANSTARLLMVQETRK